MNKRDTLNPLANGEKIHYEHDSKNFFYYLNEENNLIDSNGDKGDYNGLPPEGWEIYEEPKPKKMITLTRPKAYIFTHGRTRSYLFSEGSWYLSKDLFYKHCDNCKVEDVEILNDEWETKEIEVSE